MASWHSDLKAENILFDGQRVWLVDWQAAFVNDRYFDLAVSANFVVTNDAGERTYFEQYFGQRPDEYQRARFFLMRIRSASDSRRGSPQVAEHFAFCSV
jgi:thiamine kinase-like enzyme